MMQQDMTVHAESSYRLRRLYTSPRMEEIVEQAFERIETHYDHDVDPSDVSFYFEEGDWSTFMYAIDAPPTMGNAELFQSLPLWIIGQASQLDY